MTLEERFWAKVELRGELLQDPDFVREFLAEYRVALSASESARAALREALERILALPSRGHNRTTDTNHIARAALAKDREV